MATTSPTVSTTSSSTPTSHHPAPVTMKEASGNLFKKFKDFDDAANYEEYTEKAVDAGTRNFVVRFGIDEAQVATDLDAKDFQALLDANSRKKHEKFPITWIHVWGPGSNEKELDVIGGHYKFSTRLSHSILLWDKARRQVAARDALKFPKLDQGRRPKSRRARDVSQSNLNGQTEKSEIAADKFHDEDLAMYKLLQGTYNYTTIDHGPGFMCIGANWLHLRPAVPKDEELEHTYDRHGELVPPKHWNWYALTGDHTVVSIQEAPYFDKPVAFDVDDKKWEETELQNMRQNIRSLLCQLSKEGIEKYKLRFSSSKGVRSDLIRRKNQELSNKARTNAMESSVEIEASSNLFYYLFEDYSAVYPILDTSRQILSELTDEVVHITDRKNKDKDTSGIIKTLYARSKELRQLKHLFESYEKLIRDIVALGTDNGTDGDRENTAGSHPNLPAVVTPRGVKLSQKAYDRFDRLNVRMKLLMLDTLDEYLAEKQSLSDTYFNLIAQKDSQATARLTRSATLLAKLSVFFLPISFVTAYFSIQVPDLTDHYTGTTYWVVFAITAALSFISLFFFSRLLMLISDVLDEKVKVAEKWTMGHVPRVLRLGKWRKKEKVDDDD